MLCSAQPAKIINLNFNPYAKSSEYLIKKKTNTHFQLSFWKSTSPLNGNVFLTGQLSLMSPFGVISICKFVPQFWVRKEVRLSMLESKLRTKVGQVFSGRRQVRSFHGRSSSYFSELDLFLIYASTSELITVSGRNGSVSIKKFNQSRKIPYKGEFVSSSRGSSFQDRCRRFFIFARRG